jgi:hypothetical protein
VAVAVSVAVAVAVSVAVAVGVSVTVVVGVGVGGVRGASKTSTRLFASSPTYRLPSESIATPAGWHMAVALGGVLPGAESAQKLSVKSVPLAPCPKTWLAVTLEVAKAWLYSSTRLLN